MKVKFEKCRIKSAIIISLLCASFSLFTLQTANAEALKIYHIDDVCSITKKEEIEIAIIAVPAKVAQEVIDEFVKCGIRAFLNFAQLTIKVPENVFVRNENMSIELEALSYYLSKTSK